jgi:hypothetical protein
MVNNFKARRFAKIVDTGDVDQVIEQKLIAAEFRDLSEVLCRNRVTRLATKLCLVSDSVSKRLDEGADQVLSTHGRDRIM